MPDHIDAFIKAGRHAKSTDNALTQLSPETIRAAAKELARLRGDERRRAALARKNGRAGGRPRAPEASIKPASARRREYRERLKTGKVKIGD